MNQTKNEAASGASRLERFVMPHVCQQCGKTFKTDELGRRESDWIVSHKFCDIPCNLAACDDADGRSISFVVLDLGDVKAASRRIRNVFDAAEFSDAMKVLSEREAARLGHNDQAKGPGGFSPGPT